MNNPFTRVKVRKIVEEVRKYRMEHSPRRLEATGVSNVKKGRRR